MLSSIARAQVTHCTVTCYQPVKEQCNNQPLITSDNSKIDLQLLRKGKLKWCAISRDLLWLIPLGSKINIEGFGTYIVHDITHKRFNHRIDILIHPKDTTRICKQKVKIKVVH